MVINLIVNLIVFIKNEKYIYNFLDDDMLR